MITDIQINNYKSFSDFKLSLNSLNIIIGSNGSGKSNFIDAIKLLTSGAKGEFVDAIGNRGGIDNIIFKRKNKFNKNKLLFNLNIVNFKFSLLIGQDNKNLLKYNYEVVISNSSEGVFYINSEIINVNNSDINILFRDWPYANFLNEGMFSKFENILSKKNQTKYDKKELKNNNELAISQVIDESNYPSSYNIYKIFNDLLFYDFIDTSIESIIRRPQLIRPGFRLTNSGSNLFSVLYSIQQNYSNIWEDIQNILLNIYPEFNKIAFPPEGGDGKIILRWWERSFKDFGFPPSMLSDGTLKLIFLITLLKAPDPPPLICIDEPETGLHPEWIKLVAELLAEASTRTQIIVTTHSPELVSKMNPENILVCEKEDGATFMERLDEKELTKWLKEYSLGELWLSGHFGGR